MLAWRCRGHASGLVIALSLDLDQNRWQRGNYSRNTGVAIELLMPVDPNWFTVAGGVIIVAIMVFEAWTFAGTRRWIDSFSTRARADNRHCRGRGCDDRVLLTELPSPPSCVAIRKDRRNGRSLPISMFVSSGERHPAPWLPEREAKASKSEQHHRPGGGLGDAGCYVRIHDQCCCRRVSLAGRTADMLVPIL